MTKSKEKEKDTHENDANPTQGDGHKDDTVQQAANDTAREEASADTTRKGAMPPTTADVDPQRGAPPYPGVDRRDVELERMPHRWDDPQALVDEIDKHVKESHGSEPDKALLREISQFIKDSYLAPADEPDSDR